MAGAKRPRGAPFSLIMLDLDNFRDVNNDLGHQAGDECCAGSPAASSGPDETPTWSSATAATSSRHPARHRRGRSLPGRRACAARRRPRRDGVSASVGVATFPQDGASTDVLLAADRACFVAKRERTRRIVTAIEGLALAARCRCRSRRRSTRPAAGGCRTGRHRVLAARRHHGRCATRHRRSAVGRLPTRRRVLAGCVVAARTGSRRPARPTPTPTHPGSHPGRPDADAVLRPADADTAADVLLYKVARGDTLTDRQEVRDHGESISYWNRATYPSLDPDRALTGRTA